MCACRPAVGLVVAVLALAVCGVARADPLVVDGSSVGGHCSDDRTPAQVGTQTPWCSITRAVTAAPSGSTVQIRRGSYPYQLLHGLGSRSDYVTLEPYGFGTPAAEAVTIAGISTANTSYLRFRGLHLVGKDASGLVPAARVYLNSAHIQLVDDEMTGEGVYVQGATDVLIAHDRIHGLSRNCAVTQIGDGGGIFIQRAAHVRVLDNHVEGTPQDALNVGAIPHLYVRGNDMSNARGRKCGDHTDLVQIEGGRQGPMWFTGNVFHDGGQFILRNATGLTIEDNLILRVNNWMQLMADPGARIVGNTWWAGNALCSGCGSLLIRDYGPDDSWAKAPFDYVNHMNGTVIRHNVMRVFANDGVPRADYRENYDVVYGPRGSTTGVQGPRTRLIGPGPEAAVRERTQTAVMFATLAGRAAQRGLMPAARVVSAVW